MAWDGESMGTRGDEAKEEGGLKGELGRRLGLRREAKQLETDL